MSKKSRAYKPKACYLCGKNGRADRLEMHHVFGGPYRKKSEKCSVAARVVLPNRQKCELVLRA